MNKKIHNAIVALLLLPLLVGCSVGMAMSGKKEPNLTVCQPGVDRGTVELQLGSPTSIATQPNGNTVAVYEYELGNEPSVGRAAFHGTMDVLTLGLWELIGTPVEGFAGDKKAVMVVYDTNQKVVSVNSAAPTKPAEAGKTVNETVQQQY